MIQKTSPFGWALLLAATLLAGALPARAQVTITNADMFNQPGQYYYTYITDPAATNVTIATLLGPTNEASQAWNFTVGTPGITNYTNYYSYLVASNTPYGPDFVAAGATVAQQMTSEGTTNALQWLYFSISPSQGQLDFGFYDPAFSSVQPESVFSPALQDWPAAIHYGDTWTGTTVFDSVTVYPALGNIPEVLTNTTTAVVDAYGLIKLPNLGFLSCLRVRETVEYDVGLNVQGELFYDGPQYSLNYYWVAPGHGIVAQIDSNPSLNPVPADMGGIAQTVEWMFQAYHPVTVVTNPPPTGISGFTVSPSNAALPISPSNPVILQWNFYSGASSYTVNYATSLSGTIMWHSLGSTSSNFIMDNTAGGPGAPARFYQIVATLGSK